MVTWREEKRGGATGTQEQPFFRLPTPRGGLAKSHVEISKGWTMLIERPAPYSTMITILPQSEGSTLVIGASKKLTAKDYEEVFIPELNRLIGLFGKIRVVLYLDDSFDGWELGAMWDDAKFGLKHKHDFERVAMVGGPRWVSWITTMSSHFMSGVIKSFESTSLDEAIAWAKA